MIARFCLYCNVSFIFLSLDRASSETFFPLEELKMQMHLDYSGNPLLITQEDLGLNFMPTNGCVAWTCL